MAISSSGIGSGLNVESIVSQLLVLERRPLNRLEGQKNDFQTQLSDFGKLKSAVSDFQSVLAKLNSTSDFKLFSATSADEDVFTATADSGAAIGTFDVQVNNLAEAHKQRSRSFTDTDTTLVGGGDLTLTVNGEAFTITGAGSLTLNGLRDAINDAADNTGVTASIVSENETSNYLVLTSDNTGNDFAVTPSGTANDAGNLELTDINTPGALDAEILVDNTFTITRSTNSITDAIGGVTLNLKSESVSAVNLQIGRDNEGLKDTIQEFVDAFNKLKDTIGALREGNLSGDSTLLSIESQFGNVFNTAPVAINSSFTYLVEVGVSFNREGRLTLDADDLDSAIASDFDGLAELFGDADEGYIARLDAVANSFVTAEGLIESREDGINNTIDSLDNRISREEFRLEIVEERLRSQFTALDALVGQLQSTSSFLTQQLSALPQINRQ